MLIYLHGLNSSGNSAKATALRAGLAPYPVLAPDYRAHRPAEAVARLSAFIADLGQEGLTVIGSSMGGFYGQWLARRFRFSHLFMINPALTPWDLLMPHLGERVTTATGETYVIDEDFIEQTRDYGGADPACGVPTTVFLDRGDETIDYRIAESRYRDCARVLIWDGGDHAFAHLHEVMPILRAHLDRQAQGPQAQSGPPVV